MRARRHKHPRSWRLTDALRADRVERRLGRILTDDELRRLRTPGDELALREIRLRYGGRLEVRRGELRLSRELQPRKGTNGTE